MKVSGNINNRDKGDINDDNNNISRNNDLFYLLREIGILVVFILERSEITREAVCCWLIMPPSHDIRIGQDFSFVFWGAE